MDIQYDRYLFFTLILIRILIYVYANDLQLRIKQGVKTVTSNLRNNCDHKYVISGFEVTYPVAKA